VRGQNWIKERTCPLVPLLVEGGRAKVNQSNGVKRGWGVRCRICHITEIVRDWRRMNMPGRIWVALNSRTLLIVALFMGVVACASADTTWSLNATFSDKLTAVGTFTTSGGSSSVAPTFTSWDVTFTGGPGKDDFVDSPTKDGVIGEALLPNIYIGYGGAPTGTVAELEFAHDPGYSPYVDIYLKSALTPSGGTVTLIGGYDCPGCGLLDTGTLVDGTVTETSGSTGTALPEPSAISLLGTVSGILAIVIFRRRKRA